MKGGRLLGLRGEVTVDATIARAVNTMRVFQLLDLLCKSMRSNTGVYIRNAYHQCYQV